MKRTIIFIIIVGLFVFQPLASSAETLSSPNYNVENPQLDIGGQSSSSTNYSSLDAIGAEGDSGSSSTNYNGFWGFLFGVFPGVPAAPTLTNTGGTLYNSLDFVVNTGGNSTDTNFAVAISTDNFTTTNYIQANDTIGANAVWQTFTVWGSGAGQRITGLASNTTYYLKVKARFGANSESGFSTVVSTATVAPQITFSIAGVALNTVVAGVTTTIGTTANNISFATLPVGSSVIAAQTLTVSTNATGGYTTTLVQDGNLRNASNQISAVAASNAAPAAWPSGITTGAFGYHTTAATLCTGSASRFSSNNTYAAATTTPSEVACSSGAVGATATSIVYQLQIGSIQQQGSYANSITYITTAVY